MATNPTASRYPKRRRTVVNYHVEIDIDSNEDEAEVSEELGEDVTTPPSNAATSAKDESDHEDDESEAEDATYGSRRSKKVHRLHQDSWPNVVLIFLYREP